MRTLTDVEAARVFGYHIGGTIQLAPSRFEYPVDGNRYTLSMVSETEIGIKETGIIYTRVPNDKLILTPDANLPLFFRVNHWANGKTAVELGLAILE